MASNPRCSFPLQISTTLSIGVASFSLRLYRIFIKDLRFSRLLLCALAIASHLSFARNDRLRVLFVIASEAKQSLSKPQLFSEVSIALHNVAFLTQAKASYSTFLAKRQSSISAVFLHRVSLMSFCGQAYESVKIRSIRLIRVLFHFTKNSYMHLSHK